MRRELIEFNYMPKLKIVGCYYALSKSDELALEKLVVGSDFVAVEYDELRVKSNKSQELHPNHSLFSLLRAYKDFIDFGVDYQFTINNRLNELYSRVFLAFNAFKVGLHAKNDTKNGIERDPSKNEMIFCLDVARRLGKPVYLVDQPINQMLGKLIRLSPATKLRHLLSHTTSGFEVPQVTRIIEEDREKYMINKIEEYEGPIRRLKRNGLLVVGADHALNYRRSMLDR